MWIALAQANNAVLRSWRWKKKSTGFHQDVNTCLREQTYSSALEQHHLHLNELELILGLQDLGWSFRLGPYCRPRDPITLQALLRPLVAASQNSPVCYSQVKQNKTKQIT